MITVKTLDNLFQGAGQGIPVGEGNVVDTFNFKSKVYIVETKYDGIYCTCWWDKEGKVYLISRTGQEKINDQLQSLREYLESWELKDTAFVGELAFGSQRGTNYHKKYGVHKIDFFDILVLSGNYLGGIPILSRKEILHLTIEEATCNIVSPFFSQSEYHIITNQEQLQEAFSLAISEGQEGIMLKEADSLHTLGKKGKDWFKVKKLISMDYVIVGFEMSDSDKYGALGWIKNVICGLWVNGVLVEKCRCGSMDEQTREYMTINQDALIGSVIEIGGYEVFSSGAVRHPFFIRLREDKKSSECYWEK